MQRYASSQLRQHFDVPYSIRTNEGGLQITSDSRASVETGNTTLTLLTDVFIPPNATASTPQPLLVWIHGGGLMAGSKETLRDVAEGYARAGYVVASINYRLTPALRADVSLKAKALVQASEDLMNAIRFLRVNAARFGIDSGRIATIGYSAGGEISMVNAIEADTLAGAASDFPGESSHVSGAISTGATLVNNQWNSDAVLRYQSSDSPVLLMHADPVDGVTLATWRDNVLPTASRITGSGNRCTLASQPDRSHTADMSFGGAQFATIHAFLVKQLRLES